MNPALSAEGIRPQISISPAVWKIIVPTSEVHTDYEALRDRLSTLIRAVHLTVHKNKAVEKTSIPFRANINGNGENMKLFLTVQNLSRSKSKREPTIVVSLPEEHLL